MKEEIEKLKNQLEKEIKEFFKKDLKDIPKEENSKKIIMEQELTFGEQLVGLTFNPSGDLKVLKAKQLCAELADLLEADFANKPTTPLKTLIRNRAIGEILNAQMNTVKVLTFK